MPTAGPIVVVGGGLAAATCCETLRELGYDGSLVLVCAEPHLPYERPPLSKGYLMGADELDSVFVHPREWYDEHDVDLRLGTAATGLDLANRTVTLPEGPVEFERLLVATGATVRRLPMADDSGARVAYLRTIEDSDRLKSTLRPGCRLAVVGGGWIGLEVAAAARTAGCEVVLVEAAEQPLLRVLGPELGAAFAGLHRDHGVDVRTGVSVTSIGSSGSTAVLDLSDGSTATADLLLVGVGVQPNTELADAAGLAVDNGIVVDAHLRTSDPNVFAAGDVANAYHPVLDRHLRVEHWDNAIEQGRAAARSLLGDEQPYEHLPYFFSDQYDLGMEYVGNVGPDGYDEVVLRGDLAGRVFTAFWVKDSRVLAGMHANDWDAIDPIRRIVEAKHVDLGALRDPAVPLDELPR
jgi:NADPH-dependent 2,4-dienoyl-CoA reductase/sulfur reductase-like enzyme